MSRTNSCVRYAGDGGVTVIDEEYDIRHHDGGVTVIDEEYDIRHHDGGVTVIDEEYDIRHHDGGVTVIDEEYGIRHHDDNRYTSVTCVRARGAGRTPLMGRA
ncbi:hypothetical protein PF008_g16920 [Phytophthora fragariae]|uniref:Uncharacterized protein n=1 Tax=Phytophthora fragariae TaxID=53985 RepID=A0A6G0R9W1_9STRA|nr:hypothetical protein PF008_g16920 [Phytophthora fragariae]